MLDGKAYIFKSPAKINLFFKVGKKRVDGYHQIESIFHTINLYDTIQIKLFPGENKINLRCTPAVTARPEDNLVYRAIEKIWQNTRKQFGVEVRLKKSIPSASGLGGGSSDAATVLQAVNKIAQLSIPEKRLLSLARDLGADVPYFFYRRLAYVKGIGEKVYPYHRSLPLKLILIKPSLNLSTHKVYEYWDKVGTKNQIPYTQIKRRWAKINRVSMVAQNMFNCWEEMLSIKYPVLNQIKFELTQAGVLNTVLTGSGPTTVGLLPNWAVGDKFIRKSRYLGWWVCLAKTV